MRLLSAALLLWPVVSSPILGCNRENPAPLAQPAASSSFQTHADAGRDAGDCPGNPPAGTFGYCPDELPVDLGVEPTPKPSQGTPSSELLYASWSFYKTRKDDLRPSFVIDEKGQAFWLVTNPACGMAAYWHTATVSPSRLEEVRTWIAFAPDYPMVSLQRPCTDCELLSLGAKLTGPSGKPEGVALGLDGARRSRRGGEAGDNLVRWFVAVIRWKGHTFPECNSRPLPQPER